MPLTKLKKTKKKNTRETQSQPTVSRHVPINNDANFPKFVAVDIVANVILALAFLLLSVTLLRLTNKPSVLVERTGGESFQAEQKDPNYRSPEAIQHFTELTLRGLFTWHRVAATASGLQKEEGYIRGKTKIPAKMAAAEFGLDIFDGFRSGFMAKLTEDFSKYERAVYSGAFSQIMDIDHISAPVPIEGGGWKVDVIAHQIITTQSGRPQEVPYNQTIFIRSDHRDKLPEAKNQFEAARNEIRGYGLLIYAMRDLEQRDVTPEVLR